MDRQTHFRQPIKLLTAPRQPCAWPYAYDAPAPEEKAAPTPEAKADEPKPETKAEPKPEDKVEPKPESKDKPQPDVTPHLVKRVHELYEELGREDVQTVQDWEKADRKLEEHETHK
jgi:outer membrane biosynthesis protein TonB